MSQRCLLTREIGIDFGHRVPDHGSKCRNPHGHRYQILATCEGPVMDQAGHEENGMVVDFGNIKKYMMDWIDAVFDHGFVVYKGDYAMMNMFFPGEDHEKVASEFEYQWGVQQNRYLAAMAGTFPVGEIWEQESTKLPTTCKSEQDPDGMKVIIVNYIPTAENLAAHFFNLLRKPIQAHYGTGVIDLVNIRLFETPNGSVDYGPLHMTTLARP